MMNKLNKTMKNGKEINLKKKQILNVIVLIKMKYTINNHLFFYTYNTKSNTSNTYFLPRIVF